MQTYELVLQKKAVALMQEFSLFFTKQTKYSKNVFNVLVNKIRNLI